MHMHMHMHMQAALVKHMSVFISHAEMNLVSHDISPTDLVNTIFRDNRSVCAQVQEVRDRPSNPGIQHGAAVCSHECSHPAFGPAFDPAFDPVWPQDTVRTFVALAAHEHAPRFIRFLRMVVAPNSRIILRNIALVITLITEKDECLVLFSGQSGIRERNALIAADDAVNNPRGKLVYHQECIRLTPNP